MKKALIAALILCIAVSFFPLNVLADDGVLGGTGMTVYPIKSTRVVMEKEIIDITVKGGRSYVNCQFFFHNTGGKTSLLVGFPTADPEYNGGDSEGEIDRDTKLYAFKTYIGGERVPVKVKNGLKKSGNNKNGLYYPQWYTWRMSFERGERVKVVNSYLVKNSYGGENSEYINYILRSGSTWKGRLGKVTVRMRFENEDIPGFYADQMLPNYITENGTIVWEARNIEPDKDIEVTISRDDYGYIDNPFGNGSPDCDLYDVMGRRLLNNFYAGRYNGVTWWGHRFLKKFGENQSQGFYYLLGVSYLNKGKTGVALSYLNKINDQEDETYYPLSLYYKALIFNKKGDTSKFKGCVDTLDKYGEDSYNINILVGSNDAYVYLSCLYYEALAYKKAGDKAEYKGCIDKINTYYTSTATDDQDNPGIDFFQLWAQSRLKDIKAK